MANVGSGISVIVKNKNLDSALKKFKNKIKDYGLMVLINEKSYYTKPSDERRSKEKLRKLRHKSNQEESE